MARLDREQAATDIGRTIKMIASRYLEKDNKNFSILVEILDQINNMANVFRSNANVAHEIVDMMSDYGDNNNELKK